MLQGCTTNYKGLFTDTTNLDYALYSWPFKIPQPHVAGFCPFLDRL